MSTNRASKSLAFRVCCSVAKRLSQRSRHASHHCGIRQRSDTASTAVRPARVALRHWRQSDRAKTSPHAVDAPQWSFHGRIAHPAGRCRRANAPAHPHKQRSRFRTLTVEHSPSKAPAHTHNPATPFERARSKTHRSSHRQREQQQPCPTSRAKVSASTSARPTVV